jgi:hypothetical protein
MKILLALSLTLGICSSGFARLGDTEDQAETRYGLPKKPLPPGIVPILIQGAKELNFEFQGWKIRVALLRASDGKEYVVREEYTKLQPAIKTSGVFITDFEKDAILQAEAGSHSWHQKMIGEITGDPIQTLANQLAQISGISGKIWIRDDGATVRSIGQMSLNLILELPQAAKYEAELKVIKDREARAAVPSF